MTSIQVEDKEPLIDGEKPSDDRTAPAPSAMYQKVGSALFYATCSFMITVVNKSVLTTFAFPSYQALALGQMITTIAVLYVGKSTQLVHYPDLKRKTFSELTPVHFIYVANVIFGLGGTQQLSLPMFTMLRRFSILMTMLGEYWVLSVRPRLPVKISVGLMIAGAVIAAGSDLGFNLHGYVFVLLSDVLTASQGVFTKQILSNNKEMGKYGIMYYCALFMLPFALTSMLLSGDVARLSKFTLWWDPLFLIQFVSSCGMGFVLNYSVVLCTQHNSALTTTIMGCLKNILVTYLGMFIGGDYIFSPTNFVGINLSVVGSVLYTYVTFRPSGATGKRPPLGPSLKI